MMPKKLRLKSLIRWGPERRLEFIDFRLLWEGKINRAELVAFFGISIQQASSDLAMYMAQAPSNAVYDRSAKTYKVTAQFKPCYPRSSSQDFLTQLAASVTGTNHGPSSYIGWRPPCDVLSFPTRVVRPHTLLRVLWAIRDRDDVEIQYQSMRHSMPGRRWISPHAIASDGLRWHVRAWCYNHGEFRDFVLSRILTVKTKRGSIIDPKADHDWHTYVDLLIRARPELSPSQRSAVENDYGMKNGRFIFRCRRALVFYFLRQMHLDRAPSEFVAEQPLEVENRSEIATLIALGMKQPERPTSHVAEGN